MTATAFQATYADFKIIKTRRVAQIILEVSLEAADAAMAVLGGVPRPDQETWVGVARIAPAGQQGLPARPVDGKEDTPRRKLADMSLVQRAGMLSNDARFEAYLQQHGIAWPGRSAEYVRMFCCVESRKDIVIGSPAAGRFIELEADFHIWLAAERVGA